MTTPHAVGTAELGMAVVGAGVAAGYHAQAIADAAGARLVAMARHDPAQAGAAQAAFGVPCETSYESLLRRPDVDAVCLCTPSGQHAEQAIAAARAGKHVLVEKPMALTLADADAMVAAIVPRAPLANLRVAASTSSTSIRWAAVATRASTSSTSPSSQTSTSTRWMPWFMRTPPPSRSQVPRHGALS